MKRLKKCLMFFCFVTTLSYAATPITIGLVPISKQTDSLSEEAMKLFIHHLKHSLTDLASQPIEIEKLSLIPPSGVLELEILKNRIIRHAKWLIKSNPITTESQKPNQELFLQFEVLEQEIKQLEGFEKFTSSGPSLQLAYLAKASYLWGIHEYNKAKTWIEKALLLHPQTLTPGLSWDEITALPFILEHSTLTLKKNIPTTCLVNLPFANPEEVKVNGFVMTERPLWLLHHQIYLIEVTSKHTLYQKSFTCYSLPQPSKQTIHLTLDQFEVSPYQHSLLTEPLLERMRACHASLLLLVSLHQKTFDVLEFDGHRVENASWFVDNISSEQIFDKQNPNFSILEERLIQKLNTTHPTQFPQNKKIEELSSPLSLEYPNARALEYKEAREETGVKKSWYTELAPWALVTGSIGVIILGALLSSTQANHAMQNHSLSK